MMQLFLFLILFFLPMGIANMTPVFVSKIPYLKLWNTPVDFGISWKSHRLLGDNKTWRGLLFGTILGVITQIVIVIAINNSNLSAILPHSYSSANPLILGSLLGFGALFGDAIKSFFKRKKQIRSGKTWFPFDQIDYVLGGSVLSFFYLPLLPGQYLLLLLIGLVLHLLTVYLGYILKIRDQAI